MFDVGFRRAGPERKAVPRRISGGGTRPRASNQVTLNTPRTTRVAALPFGMEAEILWVNRAHNRRVPSASCVVMIIESALASYQASSCLAAPVTAV